MTPHVANRETSAFRLLTRVFVRRLVDNDLISPHADRHDGLAVLCAWIISVAVFVTFFLSIGYMAAFVQLPGPAALGALSDRFLFIAASIAVSALGALTVWHALALEPRDAAVLGPLPIAARTISRAKLTAVAVVGAALTIALNAAPSVLYPALLTLNMRGAAGSTILRLMATHAMTVGLAGLFGFSGILAIRGIVRALLGESAFRRASSALQSALVVLMVTALLLAPAVKQGDVRAWLANGAPRLPAQAPLWYLGLNEVLAGHLVAETPVVLPPPLLPGSFPTERDTAARVIYRGLRPRFTILAYDAWLSVLIAMALALVTYVLTNRRLPDHPSAVPAASGLRKWTRGLGARYLRDDPEAQAGFFFALQTLARSAPHRTIVAVALAGGLTHALVVLTQGPPIPSDTHSAPLGWFGMSTFSLALLLGGVSYAVRVPADSGASWTIRMAWLGDERPYVAGVKRAAMLLAISLIALMLPLHVALFGVCTAVTHSLVSLLFASASLDLLYPASQILPFACNHKPIANPKLVWPTAATGLVLVTYGLAAVERSALQTTGGASALLVALGSIAVVAGGFDSVRRRDRRPIDFEGRPAPPTQRLGLFEQIAGGD